MNIGFDAKRLFNNYTGLGNYSRTLVSKMSTLFPENEYFLYSPKTNKNLETEFFYNQDNISLRSPRKKIPLWRELLSLKMMEKDKLDLFHGLSHELPVGIKNSKIKSVVTIHDLIFKVYPQTYKYFDRVIYDYKFKYACQNSDKVIAISESTKADIVSLYDIDEAKIEVVYQACNPLFLTPQTEVEVKNTIEKYQLPTDYLLYVGSVIERKGLLKIVEALKLIKKENRPPLVIVGKGGAYAENVKKYANENNLSEALIWLSVDSNLDLQAIYQGANVFIYPSIYEGFGIPVVEALLSKTPVITSNTSSLPEAAGKHSLCVNPCSIEEIADSINKILGDTDLQNTMIDEGYKYAKKTFNTDNVSMQMMELYKNLIANR